MSTPRALGAALATAVAVKLDLNIPIILGQGIYIDVQLVKNDLQCKN